jgi:hypothetical protein
MIRVAKFGDIPGIVAVMRDAFDRSEYANADVCSFDEAAARATALTGVKRHGTHHEGSTFAAVSVTDDGTVEGFIIGLLQRFYSFTDKLEATDAHWICTERANPRDAIKLVKAMHKWAEAAPLCVAIMQANTNVIVDDAPVTRALEGLGMVRFGSVLKKDIKR